MTEIVEKRRAPRNRTIILSIEEKEFFLPRLKHLQGPARLQDIENCTINQDLYEVLDYLPEAFVDLMFIDPPYNLTKSFNGRAFKQMSIAEYARWIDSWLCGLVKTLKPNASIYVCGVSS